MSKALQAVSINGMDVCQWGVPYQSDTGLEGPASWAPKLATSFRVADDITDDWGSVIRIMNQAIPFNLRNMTGPGSFADMDLLEVGNPGMTQDEQASHFAIWVMFKSNLIISTVLERLSDDLAAILKNKDLIDINQDPLGAPVTLLQRLTNDFDLLRGPYPTTIE
jgi:alpha-galactosidase